MAKNADNLGEPDLHNIIKYFIDTWGPPMPERVKFVLQLRRLLEIYGRAALTYE